MKVLLLSAYAAGSHVSWRRLLQVMLPEWDWTVLEMPPRHFSWRMRGNPLYWSQAQREELHGNYDLLLATSMVDLATLRGLVPELARFPAALYFHENQFDYPPGKSRHGNLEPQMVSLYSALAADCLLFNSHYNRDGFLRGCEQLLGRLPDKVPKGIAEEFAAKSAVLAVPVALEQRVGGESGWPGGRSGRPLRLLWTGRFEYDKGGERLLAILQRLEGRSLDYQLAVVGQQFRQAPPVFAEIARMFEHRLVRFGFVPERRDYEALLGGADIVLSTALHEFQGLAVMEAVSAGCLPVVPDRLAYREFYPRACRYTSCLDGIDPEAESAVECLLHNWRDLQQGDVLPPDFSRFSVAAMAPRYRCVLEAVNARAG